MNDMKEIRLYGILGSRFGRVHHFNVASPREAMRALSVNYPAFKAFMASAHKRGLTFAIFKDSRNISEDEVNDASGSAVIKVVPVIQGAKRAGIFQTILGVALIAVAAIATGGAAIGLGAATFASTGAWGTMALMGGALFLGGVVQMLSPQQKGLSVSQDSDNSASYAFGGPVNTQAQGNPVPYLAGTREIGGAIISAGIYAEDQQ